MELKYEVRCGDALALLRKIPSDSVQCVVTSPPYWGLRDYGTAQWDGGDPACDHKKAPRQGKTEQRANRENHSAPGIVDFYRETCGLCSARRIDLQLGLEPTPELYTRRLAIIFNEVRRVLFPQGTLWLNIGDTYATGAGSSKNPGSDRRAGEGAYPSSQPNRMPLIGLKPKELVGIPWRVAFFLQSQGWYLRRDIIWQKPNPMPESVEDRCTTAHEYLFHFAKSETYYYDSKAIREPCVSGPSDVKKMAEKKKRVFDDGYKIYKAHESSNIAKKRGVGGEDGLRNRRSVWTIATQPYKGAHFAVMPEELVAPCILAGSMPGGLVLDPFCGAGTVGKVAKRLGRSFLGLELNPENVALSEARLLDA